VDYWKASDEIGKTVQDLIGQNHPDLALIADEIVVVFREKAGKSGGQVILGRSSRASALANALANQSYKFIIEVAADMWEHELGSKQREALLDHLLCSCRCEEDPKSGDMKCSIAAPDIMAYRENVERYGMWFPQEEDAPPEEQPLDELLGTATE